MDGSDTTHGGRVATLLGLAALAVLLFNMLGSTTKEVFCDVQLRPDCPSTDPYISYIEPVGVAWIIGIAAAGLIVLIGPHLDRSKSAVWLRAAMCSGFIALSVPAIASLFAATYGALGLAVGVAGTRLNARYNEPGMHLTAVTLIVAAVGSLVIFQL